MAKFEHEIRCPIHDFVKPDRDELAVIDSRPVQRLRDIHQLALTSLLYPAASHKRFEHSLGVMHLAGKIFDVLVGHVHSRVREFFPWLESEKERQRLRQTVRLAALCHDVGHLPFSHAAEKRLLPVGASHETLSRGLILSPFMEAAFKKQDFRIDPLLVAKLALGAKGAPSEWKYEPWEEVLAEIVVGDVFGADRMDYLLRDAYHLGVSYGRFDQHRLIQTLRILPTPAELSVGEGVPMIGVERGGLQSAEALLWARYQMYSQVYFHRTRKIHDEHLADFMVDWLRETRPDGFYPVELEAHLGLTDSVILSAIQRSVEDPEAPGHVHARRLMRREHFQLLFDGAGQPVKSAKRIGQALADHPNVGTDFVRTVEIAPKQPPQPFPVLDSDGNKCIPSSALSPILAQMPDASLQAVYVDRLRIDAARAWLHNEGQDFIPVPPETIP